MRRRRARVAGVSVALALVATAWAEGDARAGVRGAPPKAADDPRRAVVAVIGDSIAEGAYLPSPAEQALGPQLRGRLARAGIDPGGQGFVAAHPATLAPTREAPASWPIRYRGGWLALTGAGPETGLESRADGAGSVARFVTTGHATAALFAAAGPVRIALRSRSAEQHAETSSASSRLQLAWLPTSPGTELELQVRAGRPRLLGFFSRRSVDERPQVEVSMLVRGGAAAGDGLGRLDRQGLAALRPDATVLLLGTNDALRVGWGTPGALDRLEAGLRELMRTARRSGTCLLALPPRVPLVPIWVATRVEQAMASFAAAEGCAVTPRLRDALQAPDALVEDGLHPSPTGVRRLAGALAPLLARCAARPAAQCRPSALRAAPRPRACSAMPAHGSPCSARR
jgi:lysophospholipase L1-like esterase